MSIVKYMVDYRRSFLGVGGPPGRQYLSNSDGDISDSPMMLRFDSIVLVVWW